MSDLDHFLRGVPFLPDSCDTSPWCPPLYSLAAARAQAAVATTADTPSGCKLRPQMEISEATLKQIMQRFGGYSKGPGKAAKTISSPFSAQTIVDALKALFLKADMMEHRGDVCAFIAQVAHESDQLNQWTEAVDKKDTPLNVYEPIPEADIKTANEAINKANKGTMELATKLITTQPKLDVKARLALAESQYYEANGGADYKAKVDNWRSPAWKNRVHNTGQRGGLGNKDTGDGRLFLGRGPMQLTGRDNYTRAQAYLKFKVSIVTNPDQVATDCSVGMETARWFWKKRSKDVSLLGNQLKGFVEVGTPAEQQLVNTERGIFNQITKTINAAAKHSDERWDMYVKAVRALWWEKI